MKTTTILFLLLIFFNTAYGQFSNSKLFDMEAILDPSTLDTRIIEDWHLVEGKIPTQQKLIEIHVGEFYKGEVFRVPVRFIVPVNGKAKGFHLTGGHRLPEIHKDALIKRPTDIELIKNNVGIVHTVLQKLSTWNNKPLEQRIDQHYFTTLDPKSTVQYFGWPAQLMRAITAAYNEKEYFEQGKVLISGGSKNGASPSIAVIHDKRITAVHAGVSPYATSGIRMRDKTLFEKAEKENEQYLEKHQIKKSNRFLGGFYGPSFIEKSLAAGHTWKELEQFAQQYYKEVFIAENMDQLNQRNVDLLFHPGTHDFVCYDIPLVDKDCQHIPVYLQRNSGHGHKIPFDRQPDKNQQNLNAFILKHFLGSQESFLSRPSVSTYQQEKYLKISFTMAPGEVAKSVQIFWMFDRPFSSTTGYIKELFPLENAQMLSQQSDGTWSTKIKLPKKGTTVDFYANFEKELNIEGQKYSTYISSPYQVININKQLK
ncbi:hypothetical protein [Flammeovirga sp. SubArs3]|uniref:hypothetical protein n=1 Tax=Flammeovirga sp. SubArs3 TaxID=2995316 RepID=UPI00248C97F4|nr:hypothetical protein [Flammeovirga sp. SubArs3]